MKFDQTIQHIAESLYELETEVNQDFQKWKAANPNLAATASAYLHFKKGRTDDTYAGGKRGRPGKASSLAAPVVSTAPIAAAPETEPAMQYKELPDTLATKNKVEEIFNADPDVGLEEVMTRVKADAENGEVLNTDDEVIINAYNELSRGRTVAGAAEEPALDPQEQKRLARHAAIRAGMERRGMKTGDAEKLLSKLGKKKLVTRSPRPEREPLSGEIEYPPEDAEGMPSRRGSRSIDFED